MCAPAAPAQPACGETRDAPGPPRPIAVLIQYAYWNGGANLPLFVLYDDGTVIYPAERGQRGGWRPSDYRVGRVPADSTGLLERFGIGAAFRALRPEYDYLPRVSDVENVFLHTWFGDSLHSVNVRAGRIAEDEFHEGVPAAFREVYRRMVTFRAPDARPWAPDSVEVAVWPYDYAPDDPPLEWPAGWPDLDHPRTVRGKSDTLNGLHLLYLPGEQEPALRELLAGRRQKQALRMNGRKWAVEYRIQFPGEARWRPLLEDLET